MTDVITDAMLGVPHKENPKLIRAQKDGKAPLEYLITELFDGDARTHESGAIKYGIRNWRIDKILASTYKAAMLRHLKAWAEGYGAESV